MATSDPFYEEILAEVDAVLVELGTSYQVRGNTGYDPDTLSTQETAPRNVIGLVADQKRELISLAQTLSGSAMQWTATKTLILSASANPKPEEEVEVDGKWYPLSKVVPVKPADVILLYMLDVTR